MAMGVEKHWQQERDDNERHARQTLQNLATSLVTDYKVSLLLPACLPACRILGQGADKPASPDVISSKARNKA